MASRTIIVSLGEYEPTDNETPTEDAPTVFNSTRELIKNFQKMHPNVTVEVDKSHPTSSGDYVAGVNQWMLPRLAPARRRMWRPISAAPAFSATATGLWMSAKS